MKLSDPRTCWRGSRMTQKELRMTAPRRHLKSAVWPGASLHKFESSKENNYLPCSAGMVYGLGGYMQRKSAHGGLSPKSFPTHSLVL